MNRSILFCIFNLFWCTQLSAEESALQTANRPSLEALWGFVTHPTGINASRLVGIPCLYEVLEYHKSKGEGYPGHLLSLCKWMWQRGESLLKSIIVHQAPSTDESAHLVNHDWKKVRDFKKLLRSFYKDDLLQTGCSYTMPQVWHWPQYCASPGSGSGHCKMNITFFQLQIQKK